VCVDDELELMVVPHLASYISLRSSAASYSGIAVRVMFEEVASRSQSSRRRRVAHLVMLSPSCHNRHCCSQPRESAGGPRRCASCGVRGERAERVGESWTDHDRRCQRGRRLALDGR